MAYLTRKVGENQHFPRPAHTFSLIWWDLLEASFVTVQQYYSLVYSKSVSSHTGHSQPMFSQPVTFTPLDSCLLTARLIWPIFKQTADSEYQLNANKQLTQASTAETCKPSIFMRCGAWVGVDVHQFALHTGAMRLLNVLWYYVFLTNRDSKLN